MTRSAAKELIWLVLATLAAASMAHFTFAIWSSSQPAGFSDLYAPWWGSHELLLHSRNPYSPEIAHEIQAVIYGARLHPTPEDPSGIGGGFAYPPWAALLLWPSLYLPFPVAQQLCFGLSVAATLLSLGLWTRALRLRVSTFEALTFALFVLGSFPTLQGLELHNLSLLAAALIAAALFLIYSDHLILAGIFLAASTFKPQFVVALIPWLALWTLAAWRQRRPLAWSFLISMTLLIGTSEWLLPGWLLSFLHVIRAYRHYTYGHTLFDVWLTPRWGIVASAVALAAAWAFCWSSRSEPADSPRFLLTASLLLAVTVVVIPTLAPHAQLLLLPGVLCLWRERAAPGSPGLLARCLLFAVWALLAWPWVAALGLLLARLWLPAAALHQFWPIPVYTSPVLPLAVLAALSGLARHTLGRVQPLAEHSSRTP